ncbi:hypothetical protein ACFWG5_34790 [Streptomyces hydrogenans]|uniref:hypothetical protein n=1 Tax=Streptomyces TaxID=1883 RepID=UPI0036314EE9
MKITMTVENATPEFQERLLALLAEHAAHVQIDATWTKERAERLYLALPSRARRVIKKAANNGGYVSADELRDDENSSLRGHIAPIKRAIERCAASGWWPAGMEPVVIPQGPGFGKVLGYQIPEHLVDVFKHAANKPSRDW